MKSQNVRLFDMFILAPVMIVYGIKAEGVTKFSKTFMVISGIGTFFYNRFHYDKYKK